MSTKDIWETAPGTQRLNMRYVARWKAALVFNSGTNKPPYQTLTHDLSYTGASVQYHSEEKVQTVLTLLLSPPVINGENQRVIRLNVEVKSCVPFKGGFRLGMRFLPDAELEKLPDILEKYVISDGMLASHPEADEFPTLNF